MSAEKEFWDWFTRHEVQLFDHDPARVAEREAVFDELAGQLRKVDPDLAFEFSPNEEKREFVISAGGIKRAFPAVVALVDSAPALDRWQITAFRPRRAIQNAVEFRGKRAEPKDVRFSLVENGKIAGVYLFISGFQEGDADWKQVGYLLLDETLGEFDVESRLGLIKMFPIETRTEGKRYPLAELPKLFDQLVSKLEGGSGRPS